MEAYAAAFNTWKSAQSRLEYSIQEYFNACVALKDALTVPPLSASSREFRELKLIELDLELQSFPSYTKNLSKSRKCLGLARNTSRQLSPINMLPSDLLHAILSHTVQLRAIEDHPYVTRPRKTDLVALSGVCVTWRGSMLHSPVFWTSVELVLAGTATVPCYELARLWAERSRDEPLDLLICGFKDSARSKASRYDGISVTSNLLTTLMPRVRTLNLRATYNLNELLPPILNRWAAHGTTGTAKWLRAWFDTDDQYIDDASLGKLDRIIAGTYTDTRPHDFTDFFHSLRGLAVFNPSDGSNLPIHAGLAELRINSVGDWKPSLWDIHRVLAATPRLRVLSMTNMWSLDPSGKPGFIPLDHLETLVLQQSDIWRILGFITSTSKGIKVSLSVNGDRDCSLTIQSFLARTNISHLYLRDSGEDASASPSSIFTHMPNLQSLGLYDFDISGLEHYISQSSLLDIWPTLCEIGLIGCNLTPQALEQFLLAHTPPVVYLSSHRTGSSSHDSIEELLLGHGVRVVWISSEESWLPEVWE